VNLTFAVVDFVVVVPFIWNLLFAVVAGILLCSRCLCRVCLPAGVTGIVAYNIAELVTGDIETIVCRNRPQKARRWLANIVSWYRDGAVNRNGG
jgi:hypothetical protein